MTRPDSPTLPPRHALAAALVAAAIAATGCIPASQPAADPASQTPSFGAGDMPPGTHVMVARQGQWYPATIVQPLGEGRFTIHYDNTGDQYNEVVGPDRLKRLETAGGPSGLARDYRPGEKVLVTYQGRTLLADVVVQAGADQWKVHYDGFGLEAAEQVGPDRLRRPFAGASTHAVGESLQVDVNGTILPAKVIAVSAEDKWIVRFESFGPQYDQEIGADRIRTAPPAPPPPPVASAPPPEPPPPPKPEKAAKDEKGAKGKPAAPPVEGGPTVPSGPPAVGENVLVSTRGAWFPASVTAAGASGSFKVKFASGGEEEVPVNRIVREPSSMKGLRFQLNQLVLVEYKGIWVPGKVLKQEGKGEYKIRFDGTGPENDEVVVSKRLKPR